MDEIDRQEKRQLLITLENEHAALDQEVTLSTAQSGYDQLHVSRLKKRKLLLKDLIVQLRSSVVPDVIA
ncbi:hypothetical protein AB833_30795 [Chromatiales bacterium (ex Bugula neritina AB1)]|nr:hypothetical protein AB833_30795 [Chromatiales bacterium (ex Bugula neritina AB1)]